MAGVRALRETGGGIVIHHREQPRADPGPEQALQGREGLVRLIGGGERAQERRPGFVHGGLRKISG